MKIFRDQPSTQPPTASFVLLDWSCRESFHSLHYLNRQSIPREQYEIIWIEFFDRKADAIQERLDEDTRTGGAPSVDQWLALEFPNSTCFHKHLMYNLGIVLSHGRIVTFCDSDAMFQPTFVQTIIDSFDTGKNPDLKQSGLVLHCDEVRNNDKKFYPFNYPAFEEVLGEGCINWEGNTTTGLSREDDPLHRRNYGACMSALRDDLIAIGGADEHIDYLGHICGPYEMTFRLINAGKKELWHPSEFLFHTWHPGTDGSLDHMGPHDGFNLSTTALAARTTGRLLPLRENRALQTLRLGRSVEDRNQLIRQVLNTNTSRWTHKYLKKLHQNRTVTVPIFKNILRQLVERAKCSLKKHKSLKSLLRAIFYSSFVVVKDLMRQNTQIQVNCRQFLDNLTAESTHEFAILGAGEVAELLYSLTEDRPLRIKGIYDNSPGGLFHDLLISPVEDLTGYSGKVVLGSHEDRENRVTFLKNLGIPSERIVVLM